MLRKTALTVLIIAALLVAGCTSDTQNPNAETGEPEATQATPTPTPTPEPDIETPPPADSQTGNTFGEGFFFTVNGIDIHMSAPALPIIEKLGEPDNYFEAPSCAFEGVDKSWFYQSFEVHSYPVEGEDFILSVILLDDVYGTDKFIYIGMTYDDMIAAYGTDYERTEDQFMYRLGGTSLAFIFLDDDIIQITYRYEDAPTL